MSRSRKAKRPTNRSLGYMRVSTIMQVEGGISMNAQQAQIEAVCERQGWPLTEIIDDPASSASSLNRPGMQRMLTAVKNRDVNRVIVSCLDRLTRDTRDALALEAFFRENGVDLVMADGDCDTDTPSGRLFFILRAAFAEYERSLIGERTRKAMRKRRQDGLCVGHTPFGFDRIGDRLVPNP